MNQNQLSWIKGLAIFVLLLFLAGCENDPNMILPTRIILPTATQVLTPIPNEKVLPPVATAFSTPQNLLTSTSEPVASAGKFFSGDIHTHSWLTDGKHSEIEILSHAFKTYQLDYLANSEHGGVFSKDPDGKYWNDPLNPPITFLGDPSLIKIKNKDGQVSLHPGMWRWQSLRDSSWPLLFGGKDIYSVLQPGLQALYPSHLLIQGLEWNVPAYEHASVGIVDQPDGIAISQFEYQYDEKDQDASLKRFEKHNLTHNDALTAVKDLANRYGQKAYVIINHPSRQQLYSAADLRAFNDAAPAVVIGLEGFPGHQKGAHRGDYSVDFPDSNQTARARTYGGADFMLAQVGGLMDALWGEGRRFWVFNDSDFHDSDKNSGFWPGEYSKTYTFATDLSATHIVEGMRSGQVFIVAGDLINGLDFHASASGRQAGMGSELTTVAGETITVTIRFQSPQKNNHNDAVNVNHIDLIAGDVGPRAKPESPSYKNENNASTRVIKTFTSADWKDENGWKTVTFTYPAAKDLFFRLRGTNLGLNVPGQTQNGNPLNDDLMGKNDASQAWADLWFYTNPIFVKVK
jgi:hypothetical protein